MNGNIECFYTLSILDSINEILKDYNLSEKEKVQLIDFIIN